MDNRGITMTVSGRKYEVELADNATARELEKRLPLRLSMAELNGNEKYANLDRPLPAQAEKARRIEAGDVMLWGDDCLVVFYKSFDTPYSYTRVGRIAEAGSLAKAVGSGAVEITFQRNETTRNNNGESTMAKFYDYTLTSQNGEAVKRESFKGKVVLVVNTATGCGFTPQYEPIERLYKDYHEKGLEILDIPCNQFGGQAPGTDDEIHAFCTLHYNTTFPQMKKADVNGPAELPLYTYLKSQKGFVGFDEHQYKALLEEMFAKADPDWASKPDIKWNFTKFVIDRKGNVVARFEPTADMAKVEALIVNLLEEE
ncbi:MAG: hypothetical protein J6Y80_07020 [Victivallales bacterium]|nr:hypothetical protein [Victivallales bacterium]